MVSWITARTGSADLAEEVVQQALLRALEQLATLRQPARLKAWFQTIVKRLLIDELRRQQRLSAFEEADARPTQEPVAETCACILDVLKQLRPAYAEVLAAVDLQGQSLQQVATTLGLTANHTSVRLHRARQSLRRRLYAVCGTESLSACQNCSCQS
jgi:RNA polymerase sigma factor (sigma-70 family)